MVSVANILLRWSPDPMLVVDHTGRISQANRPAEELFGYAAVALEGVPLALLISSDFQELHHRRLAEYLADHDRRPIVPGTILTCVRRDGSEFFAEIGYNTLPTPESLQVLAAIRDVSHHLDKQHSLERNISTLEQQLEILNQELLRLNADFRQQIAEQKKVEAMLRETESLYRKLVENQPDLICRFLPDTTLTFVNAAYALFFGCRPEDLLGKPFIELLSAEEQAEVLKQLASITQAEPSIQYEHKSIGANGKIHWHLWHDFAFFDHEGHITGFQSVGVDITKRKEAEKSLKKSEERLTLALDAVGAGVWEWNVANNTAVWSDDSYKILGLIPGSVEPCYENWLRCVHPDDRAEADRKVAFAVEHGRDLNIEFRVVWPDNSVRWVSDIGKLQFDPSGHPIGMFGIQMDITDRKLAEEALFEAKERAIVTLHSIGDAVITTDSNAIVEYLNPVAEALTGWSTNEAQGRVLKEVFHIVNEQTRDPAPDPVVRCVREGKIVGLSNHTLLINRYGQEYHIDDTAAPICGRKGDVLGAVLVFHDVTEHRKLARRLEYDATHDALTGLVNRAEFERRLDRAVAGAQQFGARHALCYLDLDQFKIVNDTAGHAAGDELLRQIKTILSGMFRKRDTVARIGGDEFGLLFENCPLDQALFMAQTVVSRIRDHRFHWEGRTYQIGASIGLAPITAESQSTSQILTRADIACYTAKDMGRNRVHVYQREDNETVQRHNEILGAADLRDSLEHGRFRLYYQPIVTLKESIPKPIRYEALLRVVQKGCKERGTELVLPAEFIPAAERYGLMGAIDRWVIRTAFREYAEGIGRVEAKIAINLSGNSLNDDTLLGFVEAQFFEYDFSPEQVCFEITETSAIQNLRRASDLMKVLRRHGSEFALDDFGSGLSSFHYLKTLPVNYLKIDGSFIRDIINSSEDCALVAAITQMSHTLGIRIIAEYVENEDISDRLREIGVDFAQGYFYGRPAPWNGQITAPSA